MLNRLLKRCAPWMDKGRWMHIRVVGTDPSNIRAIFNDKEIESVEIQTVEGNPRMKVTLKHVPHIIDFKVCPEVGFNFIVAPESSDLTVASNYTFNVIIVCAGDYWFFMR